MAKVLKMRGVEAQQGEEQKEPPNVAVRAAFAVGRYIRDRIWAETKPELGRLVRQGAAELGSALYTGSAYVPYGDGQRSRGGEKEKSQEGSVHGSKEPSETVHGPTIQGSKEAEPVVQEATVAAPEKEAEGSVHGQAQEGSVHGEKTQEAPQQESHEAMLERYAQQGMERAGPEEERGLER